MISRTLPPSIFSMTSRPLRVATTASSSSREAPPVGSASGAGASGCDGVPDPKRLPALREAMAASRAGAAPVRGPVGTGGTDGAEDGSASFRASDHGLSTGGRGSVEGAGASERGAAWDQEASDWAARSDQAGASGEDAGPAAAVEPGSDAVSGGGLPPACDAGAGAGAVARSEERRVGEGGGCG